MKLLHKIYRTISHIIAPPFCEWCKNFLPEPTVFCQDCFKKIQPVVSKSIQITPTYTMPVYALGLYRDPLKAIILAKSWSNRLASKQLADLLWKHSTISYATFDMIVPIPLHWTRFAYRGYNQAEVMAHHFGSMSDKPVVKCLKRIKRTPFLSSITNDKRFELVKDVFEVQNAHLIQGKHILLIDDVMTTGATMIAAAKKIARYKPASIKAVVGARTG